MATAYYSIQMAIEMAAEQLSVDDDYSDTTIRCTINDILDRAQKDGYNVFFGYNQERAIKKVRKLLK